MQRSNSKEGLVTDNGGIRSADYKKHNKEQFLYTINELW